MHRKFGSLRHGRSNYELQRPAELYRLQCWKPSLGYRSTGGYRGARKCSVATDGLRSKSWDEFAKPDAPKLDFVFTVCDNAAKEVCPIWPGQPITAHWGVADPAVVLGPAEEIKRAYRDAFLTLERRIGLFLCLPLATINKLAIKKEIDNIGHQ